MTTALTQMHPRITRRDTRQQGACPAERSRRMKLEATLTGSRAEVRGGYITGKNEDYTHSAITAEGGNRVIANALRALADDIDPQFAPKPVSIAESIDRAASKVARGAL